MWASELWSACIAGVWSIVDNTNNNKNNHFVDQKEMLFSGPAFRIPVSKLFNHEKAFGGNPYK